MTNQSTANLHKNSQLYFHMTQSIKKLMVEEYEIHKISIRTLKTDGSRLSTPIKIEGLNKKEKKVSYFGKILGHGDLLTFRSIQLLKNVYLQLYDHEPLFEIFNTPKDCAQSQFETLQMMYKIGIPTAKPYGCHQLQENLWLLVEEYLQATPLSLLPTISIEQINTVFTYLRKLHKKKIYHGDLKPDNILIADKIYILDVGSLKKDVPPIKKRGYDLASMMGSFLTYHSVEDIIRIVRKHYSGKDLRAAYDYIELVQMRPDIHFNNDMKNKLLFKLKQKNKIFKR